MTHSDFRKTNLDSGCAGALASCTNVCKCPKTDFLLVKRLDMSLGVDTSGVILMPMLWIHTISAMVVYVISMRPAVPHVVVAFNRIHIVFTF
jgi:hypothetical protein